METARTQKGVGKRETEGNVEVKSHALISEINDIQFGDQAVPDESKGGKDQPQKVKSGDPVSIRSVQFAEFEEPSILHSGGAKTGQNNIDMILDISVPIAVELGRTNMLLKDILILAPGSVVELNKLAGDAVDLMVRGKLVARGEVVVVDDNFGVRITNICGPEERLKNLT